MSLWGKYDQVPQTNTATATVTVTAANATVIGVNTKFSTDFAVGQFLYVGDNDYVITAIANVDTMTVATADGDASTLVGAQSNGSYVVSEKPKYIKYSMNIDANTVYGVSTSEMDYANTGSTESDNIAHAGWVQRTVGSGGRAGRVFYETLVAGSSIAGDADDDATLPE